MCKNKKGFTLVELLAVIVVLGIILVIAIPNVLGIISNARNDSFASTAKMMAEAARTVVTTNATYMPSANNRGKIVPWSALNLENTSKDVDGGSYDTTNSYVVALKDSTGVVRYFVTLKGSARSIDRCENTALVVDSETTVTATTVGQAYSYTGVTGTVTIE